jgi:CheY-like chemotaxis protein
VHLYFPRAAGAEKTPAAGSGRDQLPKGRERILVVEDNIALRQLSVSILESLGYTVIEAANGHEALALANRGDAFDLLFTDVVLPEGMSGPVLAAEIKKQRPSLRVLYTSGYSEDAFIHQGKLDEGVDLLQKPYRRHSLAQSVRAALDKPIP